MSMIDIKTINEIVVNLIRNSELIEHTSVSIEVSGLVINAVLSRNEGGRLTLYTDRWRITMSIHVSSRVRHPRNLIKNIRYVRGEEEMLEDLTVLRLAMPTEDYKR